MAGPSQAEIDRIVETEERKEGYKPTEEIPLHVGRISIYTRVLGFFIDSLRELVSALVWIIQQQTVRDRKFGLKQMALVPGSLQRCNGVKSRAGQDLFATFRPS